ncbi:MAG: Holliday junction branch migration protein RuvA, partial [Deltaproteobacteria bacterium]
RVVLDVGGVGYLVHCPPAVAGALPDDAEATLHVSTIVREDAITLFGFDSTDARDTFDILRDVNGVGPRLALAVLSTLDPPTLARAIASDDIPTLVKVPGIGRKTASRLCLELKGKLPEAFQAGATMVPVVPPKPKRAPPDPLRLALAQLDYRKSEIDRALADETVGGPDDAPLEDRLRAALRVLARPT